MPRLAANLSLMFNEWPFLERFEAAARAGFAGVEILFPYSHPARDIAAALRDSGLEQALFNLPPGDWEGGERGFAAMPGREREFAYSVEQALVYALATGCRRLHAMAGVPAIDADHDECERVMASNLRRAADVCSPHRIQVLVEPINRRDMPGYFLNTQAQAERVLANTGRDNVGLQMDLYHCQIVEGDLATRLRRHLARIAHVQIAGVPERHEPDTGEVDFHWLLRLLDELGYRGWVGCEYRPRNGTLAGLGWAAAYGVQPRV